MILHDLTSLIQEISNDLGYEFYVGVQKKINSTIKHLPAVWLELPSLTDVEGVHEGQLTYSVSMYLMQKALYENRLEQCDLLQNDALDLYNRLKLQEIVRSTDKFEVELDYFLFPPLGEASAHLQFKVTVDYNQKKLNYVNNY